MGLRERLTSLKRVSYSGFDGERHRLVEDLGEVLPGREFHHQKRGLVEGGVAQLAGVDDANHMGSGKACGRPRFPRKAYAVLLGDGFPRRQHLEGKRLAQGEVMHGEDDAHPPFAEQALHPVFSDEHLPDGHEATVADRNGRGGGVGHERARSSASSSRRSHSFG